MPNLKEAIADGDVANLKGIELDTGRSFREPYNPVVAPADAFEGKRIISLVAYDWFQDYGYS